MTDEELAARLAEGAGRLLLELRESRFLEGRALGQVGDKVANAFILTVLREWRPERKPLMVVSRTRPPAETDALAAYLATNPKPHWRTEAALRTRYLEAGFIPVPKAELHHRLDRPVLLRDLVDGLNALGVKPRSQVSMASHFHVSSAAQIIPRASRPVTSFPSMIILREYAMNSSVLFGFARFMASCAGAWSI